MSTRLQRAPWAMFIPADGSNPPEPLDMIRIAAAAVATLALVAPTTPVLAQDAENGEAVFKACRSCHQVGEGAKNGIGPLLNGVVGRKAGSVEGFNYSEANKAAGAEGLLWTEEKLFAYLEKPAAFMPKNKMAYAGLKDEGDRRDVIAYLKSQTAK
jgi:cytochrome c2